MIITIVLGKYLNDDGSMTDELVKRLDLGLETFYKTNSDYLALTGGVANSKAKVAEAYRMKEYVLSKGFDENKIIYEDKSLTTMLNARNLYRMLYKEKIEKIYLVSTKYHFTRKILMKAHVCFQTYFKNVKIIKVYND